MALICKVLFPSISTFKTPPAAVPSPQSWSPSAVSVDPLRNRIFALDGLAGRIAALELRDDGLHTV
jgi:hypothetical protein